MIRSCVCILVILGSVAVSGCGQKGPLVLPPPPQSQPTERPTDKPAPRTYPDVPATGETR
jgi:predicted small lipoprotein YifL